MGVRSLRAAWTGGSDIEGGSQAVRLLSLWARLLKCPHDVVASPAQTKWSEREQGGSCILSWPGPGNHIPSLLPPVHIQRQGGWGAVRLHLLKEDTSKNSPKYFKTMTVLFHTPFSSPLSSATWSYYYSAPHPPPSLHDSQGLGSLPERGVYVCVWWGAGLAHKNLFLFCVQKIFSIKSEWERERGWGKKENTLLDLWKR